MRQFNEYPHSVFRAKIKGKLIYILHIHVYPGLTINITQTRPCNIQQYFMAVKMLIFR